MDRRIVLEDLLRTESGRIVGALMRRFGDLDLAEDCYQEACLAAWEHWPADGMPVEWQPKGLWPRMHSYPWARMS